MARLYLGCVALMGLAIGVGELITLFGERQIAHRPDPVLFFLSERNAIVAGALVLLVGAILAASPGNLEKRLAGVLMTGVLLGTYQLTRLFFGVAEPCRCLQGIASVVKLGTSQTLVLKYVVIIALVVPSAGLLRWNRRALLRAS